MEISGHFLSRSRQTELDALLHSDKPAVGYNCNLSSGTWSGFHSHSKHQIVFATRGIMHIQTEDKNFIVPPATALFVPAYTRHAALTEGDVEHYALFLKNDLITNVQVKIIAVSNLLREIILATCKSSHSADDDKRKEYLAWLAIDEIQSAPQLPLNIPLPENSRLLKIVEMMYKNPNDQRTIEEWSEIANMSSRTMARMFQAQLGLSFRQWRQQNRMISAYRSLIKGESITSAASNAGFKSVSAFGIGFKKYFGTTPGEIEVAKKEGVEGQ